MRVVVIGAGLGGLTLAHGLRAGGVQVSVFERGPRSGPQPASYGIHVDGHGNQALHACLPAANWALYDRGAVPAPAVVRFRDADLGVLTDLRTGSPAEAADPVRHRRAVRRPDRRPAAGPAPGLPRHRAPRRNAVRPRVTAPPRTGR